MGTSGISPPFGGLSRSPGQVPHVLLTRSPLGRPQCCHWLDLVRLACVRHAASVRPEPGSNSPSRSRARCRSSRPFDRCEEPAIPRAEALVLCRLAPEQPALLLSVSSAFILERLRDPPRRAGQSPALACSSSLLFSRSVDRPRGAVRCRQATSRILSGGAGGAGWPFRGAQRAEGSVGRRDNLSAVLRSVNLRRTGA